MTALSGSLAERYIAAVTRRLPASLQADVAGELAASIADDIEARIASDEATGESEAERAVLTALGDPDALAAGFADRPLHLIGPMYYLTWWRLLKLLLWIVPLCAVGGVLIGKLIEGAPVGEIALTVWVVAISTIVHVGFWTTLVFVVLDRTGADATTEWSVDDLPEIAGDQGSGRGELITQLVLLGIAAGALLWDRFIGFVFVATDELNLSADHLLGWQVTAMPLLNPELWPWWMGVALLILALEAVLAVVIYARRSWNPVLAAVNTVLAVVLAAGAVYLLVADRMLNPAFAVYANSQLGIPDEVGRILAILTGVAFVGIALWDSIDGWRGAARASRG